MIYSFCNSTKYQEIRLTKVNEGGINSQHFLRPELGRIRSSTTSFSPFLKLQLEENVGIAVFENFRDQVFDLAGNLFDESSDLMEFHLFSREIDLRYTKNTRQLALGEIGCDPNTPQKNRYAAYGPFSNSKIGGVPFYTQVHEDLVDSVCEALNDGYRLILQLSDPDILDDAPDGPWIFGEYTFHLFAKKNSNLEFIFKYCWG